ncbi:MAG: hypothetical protein V1827_05935 [Candidatus Micrarchaeota archaeon]
MEWKDLSLSALAFAIIAQAVHTIGAIATMGYYTDPAYFPLWSAIMMGGGSGPGMMFYAASLAFSFLSGLIFAFAYTNVKKSIPGKGLMKGVNFGLLCFLMVQVTSALTMSLLLAVPATLLIAWAVESLVVFALCGAVFSKVLG